MNKRTIKELDYEDVESIIKENKASHSLSNLVYVNDYLVIKDNSNNSNSKVMREVEVLKALNINYKNLSNYLIIEKRNGNNIDLKSLSDKVTLSSLEKSLTQLRKIKTSSNIITTANFINKAEKNREKLKVFFLENNTYNFNFEKTIKLASAYIEDVICHGDLNQNNILLNEKGEVVLIDYEEVCYGSKYHDYSILVANWSLEIEYLNFICESKSLDMSLMVSISIIWSGLFYIWNENQYNRTEDFKYKEMMNFFNKRSSELNRMLNKS